MAADVRRWQVVEEGGEDRRSEKKAERGTGGDLPEKTQAVSPKLHGSRNDPDGSQDTVYVRDFGEAGVQRECKRHRDGAPSERPPSCRGVGGVFNSEQQEGKKGNRVCRRVGEPRERAVQGEGHAARRCGKPSDIDLAKQEVRAEARHEFHQRVGVDLSVGKREEQGWGEEGGCLHLPGERRPETLVGIPPGDVPVEPILGDEVSQRLSREAAVRIHRCGAADRSGARHMAQSGEQVDRIRVEHVEEVQGVAHQDRRKDDRCRYQVRCEGIPSRLGKSQGCVARQGSGWGPGH